ncbi:MAG: 3,4-dihydroxy-2-butanone-4-phosphate synthase [Nitrospinae bacterium]|nr:3,4-dihydroxy-2-butanone-4-phosphate synthase [Nitrospinota bacterium]
MTKRTPKTFSTIDEAVEDVKQGKMIVIVDDEDRENEGDLMIAAELCTPEAINFMAKYGRGLICLTLTEQRTAQLGLPMMVPENQAQFGTPFTVSIDAKHGITTGISAADRAKTIGVAMDPKLTQYDLVMPGHIFPLRAREGGVLVRAGQTEGSVDMARLAGLKPAGVICEVMNDDGTMARVPQLSKFVKKHKIKMITIKDLMEYRLNSETLVEEVASTQLPTDFGEFRVVAFRNKLIDQVHITLVKGELKPEEPTLVRVHSQCLTGDVFGSHRCDCGEQLAQALNMIEREGKGVLLYLYQEGRGIGILNIMLASITERTREIGIRRAIGASGWDITWQFLIETVTLATVGGLLGVLLGIAGVYVLRYATEWNAAITTWALVLSMGVSCLTGIIFGIYPARRAAAMDPIVALRHG